MAGLFLSRAAARDLSFPGSARRPDNPLVALVRNVGHDKATGRAWQISIDPQLPAGQAANPGAESVGGYHQWYLDLESTQAALGAILPQQRSNAEAQ